MHAFFKSSYEFIQTHTKIIKSYKKSKYFIPMFMQFFFLFYYQWILLFVAHYYYVFWFELSFSFIFYICFCMHRKVKMMLANSFIRLCNLQCMCQLLQYLFGSDRNTHNKSKNQKNGTERMRKREYKLNIEHLPETVNCEWIAE